MRRLSLSVRLVLIVAGAMFLLQLVAIAVQLSRDDGLTLGGIRPSFARQVAGLVRLFDRLPARRQALALEVLTDGGLDIRLLESAPPPQQGGIVLRFTAGSIAQRIADEGIPRRRLEVSYVPNAEDANEERGPLVQLFGRHMRISVQLKGGGYLVLDPESDQDSFVYGNILAIGAGIFGLLVLIVAVVAVISETRPLGALAGNVDAFARTARPTELKEQGAPDLRRLIGATNAMQRQIAALLNNRALILAGMSHDLRTQVTRLRLRLELLDDSESRGRAIADVEAMQALIEETLEFAAAGSAADTGHTDAVALLDRMAAERAQTAPGALFWSPVDAPIEVAVGATALRRVFENLIQNAIEYGQAAELSIRTNGANAEISIADRGPGIAESERRQIFEPFYRIESSRSRANGGAGLGLAIVQQVIGRHGGNIDVTDRAGGGSIFTVTLPLASSKTSG